ncbi:MAG: nitrilase-related carbon-nitrogen hydrolase, partial [Lentisphaerota bacterium]
MNAITFGLVQLNTTVGALKSNTEKMVILADKAAREGAEIIVFPELALSGYPPEDLILKQHFVDDCERRLDWLVKRLPSDRIVIIGSPTGSQGQTYNSAVVFYKEKLIGQYHKMLLPNYGVFDEKRVFLPGDTPGILRVGNAVIGLHICEDSWFTNAQPCQALQPL